MKEIVAWLIHIEDWASRIYEEAASVFSENADVHRLLDRLAVDEAMHFHFMNSALVCLNDHPNLCSTIRLDQRTIDHVEKPLKRIEASIRSGSLSTALVLESMIESEHSEWNDIFLYVINSIMKN